MLGRGGKAEMPKLFPYQQEGIAFALEREGALIADEMGTGKTIQAIGVINEDPSIEQVLIVCPASMRIPWRRELEKWLIRSLSIGIIGVDKEASSKLLDRQMLIINYDRLHQFEKELSGVVYDLAILDECHAIKNPEARRTKAAIKIKARRRIALSGTPLLNRPIELYPTLSWLSPTQWPPGDWFQFAVRYAGAHQNGFGWDVSGASNLPELSHRLRSTVMIRRTKAEVLPQLPPKIRSVIELYPDAEMQGLLKRELKAFESRLHVNHEAIDWDDLAIVRHETALAKVPLILQYLEELLDGGVEKVVVFGHHRDVIARLSEGLSKHRPVILNGGMTPKQRQDSIDRFQSDSSVRVFIGNIVAAGTGITLTAASHCVFAELSWVPAEVTQCEDRLHRLSQQDCVNIHHLVLEGSLDAVMVRVIIKKQRVIDAVLESCHSSPIGFSTIR